MFQSLSGSRVNTPYTHPKTVPFFKIFIFSIYLLIFIKFDSPFFKTVHRNFDIKLYKKKKIQTNLYVLRVKLRVK